MAGLQENIPQWFEKGVFNFFKLTPEVIAKFTIDPNASERVRREDRRKLGEEWMHGTCKFCKYNSKRVLVMCMTTLHDCMRIICMNTPHEPKRIHADYPHILY